MKSTTSFSNQRVGIFIDVQNLYHSAKNLYHGRVNYAELIKHLVGGRQLIRAMAYVVKSEGIIEPLHPDTPRTTQSRPSTRLGAGRGEMVQLSSEGAFFEALENAGLELRLKDIQVWADGSKKADWDVGMAVDAIRMAEFLDVVILVTGDGDFIPLVDYLKWGRGRMVEVAAFRRSASAKLQEAADKFINIEDIPKGIIRR
jgi:uncharacterized LabA/DUF88 family protein